MKYPFGRPDPLKCSNSLTLHYISNIFSKTLVLTISKTLLFLGDVTNASFFYKFWKYVLLLWYLIFLSFCKYDLYRFHVIYSSLIEELSFLGWIFWPSIDWVSAHRCWWRKQPPIIQTAILLHSAYFGGIRNTDPFPLIMGGLLAQEMCQIPF
jgi:hypothetical protein